MYGSRSRRRCAPINSRRGGGTRTNLCREGRGVRTRGGRGVQVWVLAPRLAPGCRGTAQPNCRAELDPWSSSGTVRVQLPMASARTTRWGEHAPRPNGPRVVRHGAFDNNSFSPPVGDRRVAHLGWCAPGVHEYKGKKQRVYVLEQYLLCPSAHRSCECVCVGVGVGVCVCGCGCGCVWVGVGAWVCCVYRRIR